MGGNQNKEHDAIVASLRKKLEAVGCMTVHLRSYTWRKIGCKKYPIALGIEPGWPDIFSFRPDGKIEFYEVKTGDAVLNPEQVKRFTELTRRGFRITIIRGPQKAREVFQCKNEKTK